MTALTSVWKVSVRIAAALLFFIIWLTSLFLVILLYPYRCLVRILARVHRPTLSQFVTGGMNVFFSIKNPDDTHTANVCVVVVLEGKLELNQFRNHFLRQVIDTKDSNGIRIYSKLRQHITTFMGYSFFEWDKSWDLRRHVRAYDYGGELALPSSFKESDLERILGGLLAFPWKDGQSPWECLLCDGLECEEGNSPKSLLIFRISHGLADGYCVQDMLQRLAEGFVRELTLPERPSRGGIMHRMKQLAFPFMLFYNMGDNYVSAMSQDSVWKVDSGTSRELCTAIMPAIPVETIKSVKSRYGVSYAAVLMAALSRGLYKIMKLGGQCPPNSLGCLMPLPKPNHLKGLTNHLYTTHMKLPLGPELTEDFLKNISRQYKESVGTYAPLTLDYIGALTGLLPQFFSYFVMWLEHGSVCIGNFPTLTDEFYVKGCRVSGVITSMALLSRQMRCGVTVSMGGADGKQRVTVNINKNVFKNHQLFPLLGDIMRQEIIALSEGEWNLE